MTCAFTWQTSDVHLAPNKDRPVGNLFPSSRSSERHQFPPEIGKELLLRLSEVIHPQRHLHRCDIQMAKTCLRFASLYLVLCLA